MYMVLYREAIDTFSSAVSAEEKVYPVKAEIYLTGVCVSLCGSVANYILKFRAPLAPKSPPNVFNTRSRTSELREGVQA